MLDLPADGDQGFVTYDGDEIPASAARCLHEAVWNRARIFVGVIHVPGIDPSDFASDAAVRRALEAKALRPILDALRRQPALLPHVETAFLEAHPQGGESGWFRPRFGLVGVVPQDSFESVFACAPEATTLFWDLKEGWLVWALASDAGWLFRQFDYNDQYAEIFGTSEFFSARGLQAFPAAEWVASGLDALERDVAKSRRRLAEAERALAEEAMDESKDLSSLSGLELEARLLERLGAGPAKRKSERMARIQSIRESLESALWRRSQFVAERQSPLESPEFFRKSVRGVPIPESCWQLLRRAAEEG